MRISTLVPKIPICIKAFCRLVPLLGALLIAGCSGKPSEENARTILKDRVWFDSSQTILLKNFHKINAVENGGFYRMEYQAEIEFTQGGMWMRGNSLDGAISFKFSAGAPQRPNSPMGFMGAVMGATKVTAGQHETFKGFMLFQKTEKGWKGEDGEIY